MNPRSSTKSASAATGLGAVIIQALESIASRDASEAVVCAALEKAGLRKLPEDPVVLLAFLSGALYQAAAARLGEEFADAMLADSKPILERAAAHALAAEEQPAAPQPSAPATDEGGGGLDTPLAAPAWELGAEAEAELAFELGTPDATEPGLVVDRTAGFGAEAGHGFELEGGCDAPVETEPGMPFEPDDSFSEPSPVGEGLPFEPAPELDEHGPGEPELPFAQFALAETEPELPFVPVTAAETEPELPFVPVALAEREPELPFVPIRAPEAAATEAAAGADLDEPRLGAPREVGEGTPTPPSARRSRDKGRTAPGVGTKKRQTAPGVGTKKRQTAPGVASKKRQTVPGVASKKRQTVPGVVSKERQTAPGLARTRQTAPGGGIKKRQTSPGVGTDIAAMVTPAATDTASGAGPAASVRRPSVDPKRLTLGYEAIVDEPTDGQGSRLCAVVAMADRTLRSIVARILRREGIGVVTAPDGSLGLLLAQRFAAGLVVVDAPSVAHTLPDTSAAPPVVLLDPNASNAGLVDMGDGRVRLGAKPLDPASLVQAIEQLIPQGWRR